MMKEIGEEMHQSTSAMAISETINPSILDMCMAPGGFLSTALQKNPGASALALSLPISEGGHRVLLPNRSNLTLEFLDITMLAGDMGVRDFSAEHPDASNMLPQRFDPAQLFDLILCDGHVLRTHVRAAYREMRETRRLTVTQLAIGLEHVKCGGNMIVLLHKVEAIHNVFLLYTFSKFSSVKLFKPKKHHGKRSSFYMIATNIQSQHGEAILAVKEWKRQWSIATFGSDTEYEDEFSPARLDVEKLLNDFGKELIQLGRDVWATQASPLQKAPFIKK
jgi:23S rRNA U2552 (ribose-2'-O)-methylase RlmE/FtsJ